MKLTSQMPTGGPYPYYPQPEATILTSRDVDYDFRAGLEVRVGSTFTIGESCNTCQSSCGYNTGCGCNSCAPPTTYAWEVAWWGLDNSPDDAMVMFNGTDRIYGMKSYVGLEYDRDGAGGAYAYRPVNDYYDYQMPIIDPPAPSVWTRLRPRGEPTRPHRLQGPESRAQLHPLPGVQHRLLNGLLWWRLRRLRCLRLQLELHGLQRLRRQLRPRFLDVRLVRRALLPRRRRLHVWHRVREDIRIRCCLRRQPLR